MKSEIAATSSLLCETSVLCTQTINTFSASRREHVLHDCLLYLSWEGPLNWPTVLLLYGTPCAYFTHCSSPIRASSFHISPCITFYHNFGARTDALKKRKLVVQFNVEQTFSVQSVVTRALSAAEVYLRVRTNEPNYKD